MMCTLFLAIFLFLCVIKLFSLGIRIPTALPYRWRSSTTYGPLLHTSNSIWFCWNERQKSPHTPLHAGAAEYLRFQRLVLRQHYPEEPLAAGFLNEGVGTLDSLGPSCPKFRRKKRNRAYNTLHFAMQSRMPKGALLLSHSAC